MVNIIIFDKDDCDQNKQNKIIDCGDFLKNINLFWFNNLLNFYKITYT